MKLYFTFDCEDFINPRSTKALKFVLEMLNKYDFKGIFFMTAQIVAPLRDNPETLDLLRQHEIGYHSTSHSVHPGIIEYTDVKNYDEAFRISLKRETSQIDPLTGRIEGKGGLTALTNLFPNKKIVAFRAPGFSWSPPHLEALVQLGIRFDFSANISPVPVSYKKVTFYPFPILSIDTESTLIPLGMSSYDSILSLNHKLLLRQPLVFLNHPHFMINSEAWDDQYFSGNPVKLYLSSTRSLMETEKKLRRFELILKRIHFLANRGFLEVTVSLEEGLNKTHFSDREIMQCYLRSTKWFRKVFNYSPTYMLNHFLQYFGANKMINDLRNI